MIDRIIHLIALGWRSAFEIVLLTVVIYYGYLYFRGTRGAKVLTGLAIVFLALTLISTLLKLAVIGWILRSFSVFLAIALVVIFQPELRRALAALGGHPIFSLAGEKREMVHDLAEAELCYAPQFGAAKDPVNLAGMLAENVLKGDMPLAEWAAQKGTEVIARL